MESGHREIVLCGIHIGHWGRDLDLGLEHLLDALARLEVCDPDGAPLPFRLRLSSIEATEVTRPVLDVMSRWPQRIAPHLHMPMQAGDDGLLARMNRWYTVDEYLDACDRIRAALPEPAFTADLLVGFPGEDERAFENTLEAATRAGFARIHVFPFSARPGTAAWEMGPPPPPETTRERRARLAERAYELGRSYRAGLDGLTDVVVLEGGRGPLGSLPARAPGSGARGRPAARGLRRGALRGCRRERGAGAGRPTDRRTDSRSTPPMSERFPDPELAELAAALRLEVRRRRSFGQRFGGRAAVVQAMASAPPNRGADAPPASAEPPVRPPQAHPERAHPEPARPQPARKAASAPQESLEPAPPTAGAARSAPDLDTLRTRVSECTACELCRTRKQTVFSDGSPASRVVFVGEAPGAEEDRTGTPFVGRAGQLLTDIITKGMGLAREDVYIANVLKCRPPDNRDPTAREKALCTPFLERQLELVDPAVVIPLGRHAAGHVLGSDAPMGRLRGRVHERGGRLVIPTFHPAYLLRSPQRKKDTWADIQLAMAELGLEPPSQGDKKHPDDAVGAEPGEG